MEDIQEAVESLKKENNGVLLYYYEEYILSLNGKQTRERQELRQEILDRMSIFRTSPDSNGGK